MLREDQILAEEDLKNDLGDDVPSQVISLIAEVYPVLRERKKIKIDLDVWEEIIFVALLYKDSTKGWQLPVESK